LNIFWEHQSRELSHSFEAVAGRTLLSAFRNHQVVHPACSKILVSIMSNQLTVWRTSVFNFTLLSAASYICSKSFSLQICPTFRACRQIPHQHLIRSHRVTCCVLAHSIRFQSCLASSQAIPCTSASGFDTLYRAGQSEEEARWRQRAREGAIFSGESFPLGLDHSCAGVLTASLSFRQTRSSFRSSTLCEVVLSHCSLNPNN
jgi:hypothetical protein